MKKLYILLLLCIIGGCSEASFPAIPSDTDFVASLNTLGGSIDFISKEAEILETWELEEAYTGFTLVTDDLLLVYGYGVEKAALIELSTGKQIASITVGEGTTYAYVYEEKIYIANGQSNTVSLYNTKGKKLQTSFTGNYPMAMISDGSNIFVVNFKDEFLSVLTMDLEQVDEWMIPTSSHGLFLQDNELWLGGHGAGSSPNRTIKRINIKTGELIGEIEAPLMPINMARAPNRHIFSVSHGSSMVYEISETGEVLNSMKVGANPFWISSFGDNMVLAGYDDHQLYFIQSNEIIKEIQVGKGPFQLIVREVK
ncbi:hypothetical protein MKY29_16325 [Psychrobacillus sp. FSL K6-2365]|uniref:YncE family protein n=1 Tax=unclassified Psychrobacillus TaxID=2636677 RepID=UPI0030FC4A8D